MANYTLSSLITRFLKQDLSIDPAVDVTEKATIRGLIGAANAATNTGDETTNTILEQLKGVVADPNRIGGEFMPEVIPNVLLELADVSALGAALPLGSMGRDASGNPLVGDGVTIPGNLVGTPNIYRLVGTLVKTEVELDSNFVNLLGSFPVPAAKAAIGEQLRMRGKIWFVSSTTNVPFRIGIIPASVTQPTTSINQAGLLYGFAPSGADASFPVVIHIDQLWDIIDATGGYVKLSDNAANSFGSVISRKLGGVIDFATFNSNAGSSANKLLSAAADTLNLYVVSNAKADSTGLKIVYDLEFIWK